MTREEIRGKYAALMEEVVKGNSSRLFSEEFQKLRQACPHPYGGYNYEIGCWVCPDCGMKDDYKDCK